MKMMERGVTSFPCRVLALVAAWLIAMPVLAQVVPVPVACVTPTKGCWKQLPNPGTGAVNVLALKTGKIMLQNRGFVAGQQIYEIFDPITDTFSATSTATVSHNMYCSGFDQTGESGDILFAGGLFGDDRKRASVYHPDTDTWTAKPDMDALRFYPTVITLSNRAVLALDGSGSASSNIPESYDIRSMKWGSLFAAEYGLAQAPPKNFELPNYPRFHVLSTGKLIYTGSEQFIPAGGDVTRILDPVFETWEQPFAGPDPIIGNSGVMYDRDQIMKAGGGTNAWSLAATTPGAQWTQLASMSQSRFDFFTVALPDGNVLAVGDVATPEIYDVDADTWTSMTPAPQARGDHSGAVLLHAGPSLTADVFSPPYLFNANGTLAKRPVISRVIGPSLGVIQYGEPFKLVSKTAALIDEIRLIRLGAATHSWDMGQQSMELDFAPACCNPDDEPGVNGNPFCFEGATCCADGTWACNNGDLTPNCPILPVAQAVELVDPALVVEPVPSGICTTLTVEAPQHPYQSPPGFHYLSIIDGGVPSKSAIIQAVVCP